MGNITWKDKGSDSDWSGVLPYGDYTNKYAIINFCCATSGNPYKPLYLPPDQDFVLFKLKGSSTCQKVTPNNRTVAKCHLKTGH